MRAKFSALEQTDDMRLLAKFRLDRFILLPFGGKKPQFLPVLGLRHLVVSPVRTNLRKLNTGEQLRTFPYPTISKSFLNSNAFTAKSGTQTLTFKSVMDRQTDGQTKNSMFLAAAGEIRAQPNLVW